MIFAILAIVIMATTAQIPVTYMIISVATMTHGSISIDRLPNTNQTNLTTLG